MVWHTQTKGGLAMPRSFLSRRRRGLTLIELLVVISLLTVLITLTAVYVVPSFRDNKNVQRGVDQTITALLTTKQRSLRDQAPRGIRFLIQPDGTCNELQVIEQPNALRVGTATPNGATIDFIFPPNSGIDLTNAAGQDVTQYLAQPGDFFRVEDGTPATYLVKAVTGPTQIQLNRAAIPFPATTNWRIIRQPRPLTGDANVKLPAGVVLDIGFIEANFPNNQVTKRLVPGQPPPPYFEVLFDPAGAVMDRSSTPVVIWARQVDAVPANKDPNANLLIALYPRTGLIASHPIDPHGPNPIAFALDGKSSGM
jgi:prepilin-type N-terminal cleavage/methylation domain-containing protein